MDQMAQPLGGTFRIGTTQRGFTLLPRHRRATGGTDARHLVRCTVRSVVLDPQHFGNDIPRFAHNDLVANADALFADKIFVVQRGTADGRTRQCHRFKHTGRCQYTGAPHLHLHIQQGGQLFLRRVFISHRPFGVFGGAAKQCPIGESIHLDHRTVNIKRQRAAQRTDALHLLKHLID